MPAGDGNFIMRTIVDPPRNRRIARPKQLHNHERIAERGRADREWVWASR